MNINFSDKEVIFLYGFFKKKIQKLELLKQSPNCPIDSENINCDIKLYSSIVAKLEEAQPKLSKLKPYF